MTTSNASPTVGLNTTGTGRDDWYSGRGSPPVGASRPVGSLFLTLMKMDISYKGWAVGNGIARERPPVLSDVRSAGSVSAEGRRRRASGPLLVSVRQFCVAGGGQFVGTESRLPARRAPDWASD